MNEQPLLGLADDELVLGWRDSEWTGIAPLLEEAVGELWPYALGVLDDELRPQLVERTRARLPFALPEAEPVTRGRHTAELRELWEEMTIVRRSAPAGARW